MSVSQEIATPVDVTVESMALVPRDVFLEPRCRVCRNDLVRKKVNDMLAAGSGYAFIVRALGEDNANCDRRDLVTIDSVRNHCERHSRFSKFTGHLQGHRGAEGSGEPDRFRQRGCHGTFAGDLLRGRDEQGVPHPGRRSHRGQVETGLRAAEKLQSVLDGRERGPMSSN